MSLPSLATISSLFAFKRLAKPATIPRAQLVTMYRPLARAYFVVVLGYYAVALFLMPFLEPANVALTMSPLRISVALLACGALYAVSKTSKFFVLELATALVSLHIAGNFSINEYTAFRPEVLSNFQIIIVLFCAVSPSLRVLFLTAAPALAAWLWLVADRAPALLSGNISIAIVGAVVGGLTWALITHALRSAARAVMAAETHRDEMERFAYICSHDMQEPVRMMNAYAGLLEDSIAAQPDESASRYLRYIRDNAARLQKMIRDILAFSRVGREDIRIETVDCNIVVASILSEFQPVITGTRATVRVAPLPKVETSPALVHMLFHNLISNALKFQDGTRPPEIVISADQDKTGWWLMVADNGIGIDPEHSGKVFTLFQRLQRKEDFPGTGLGLSTCRKFLRLCGGDMTFSSEPGKGSTFRFCLPDRSGRPSPALPPTIPEKITVAHAVKG